MDVNCLMRYGRNLLVGVGIFIGFLVYIAGSEAYAAKKTKQQAAGVTLENAVKRAVQWHPSIDEAVNNLNMRQSRIDEAEAGYLPRISAGANSGYSSRDRNGWRPYMSVTATQMIYDFGKVRSTVDVASAGTEVGKAQLLLAVDHLIRETATAYIEVQRYNALLAVARQQLNGVNTVAKLVSQRSQEGASTRSDLLQAEARVEAAETTILEITTQMERWESNLAYLTGAKGKVGVNATVPKWFDAACNIKNPDWNKVPAIIQAEAQGKEALAQLAETRAQALPTLSLKADAGYDMDATTSRKTEFNVGLYISGDLYQGGAATARRNAAGYALRASEAARDRARLDVQHSLREASVQTGSMGRLLGSLSARDKMMQETRDLYQKQYIELGTRTLLDLLNAEQELHQARFNRVNTLHDIRRLDADCLYSSGMLRSSFALNGISVRGVVLTP